MRINDVLRRAKKELTRVSDTPDLDAEVLLSAVLEKPRTFLLSRPEYFLSTPQQKQMGIYLQKRLLGEPIAYILRTQEFYGLEFEVNEHTLVPRPETEMIIEKAIPLLKNGGTLIDIGTGSGCIPISITKNSSPKKIIATDISEEAIETAKKNAKKHQIEIEFIQSDLFTPLPEQGGSPHWSENKLPTPIIITANLPYVPENEKHPSTQKEPETAIYSGKDGLDHYRDFFLQLKEIRFDTCLFEFHPPQKEIFQQELPEVFPEKKIEFFKDLAGLWRIGVIE